MRYLRSALLLGRSHRVSFGFSLLFLLMWLLFGWNTGNADYSNYQQIYNSIEQYGSYSAVEAGFEFVCRLSNLMGLSYNVFLIIYSFIGLYLIADTARRFTNNSTLMFVLYFIYPFLLDIVQIRNFMSMALMIFATRYLVTNKKKDYIKYIIFILIASTFHYTALFYLLFLLVKIKSYKKLTSLTLVLVIIGILARSILPNIVYLYLNMDRYSTYFSYSTSLYAKFLFFVYFILNALLILFIYKRIKSEKNLEGVQADNHKYKNKIAFAEVVMKINILIFTVYVLVLTDVDFIRLFRNILPLNYILFSMIKPKNKFTKNAFVLLHSWCFIAFVALSSWAFIFFQTYQSVVHEILNRNIIFDYFK